MMGLILPFPLEFRIGPVNLKRIVLRCILLLTLNVPLEVKKDLLLMRLAREFSNDLAMQLPKLNSLPLSSPLL